MSKIDIIKGINKSNENNETNIILKDKIILKIKSYFKMTMKINNIEHYKKS